MRHQKPELPLILPAGHPVPSHIDGSWTRSAMMPVLVILPVVFDHSPTGELHDYFPVSFFDQ